MIIGGYGQSLHFLDKSLELSEYCAASNPSFSILHLNRLYFVQQNQTGLTKIYNYQTKELLQELSSLGASPCHIAINQSATFLAVSNYSSGSFVVYSWEGGKWGIYDHVVRKGQPGEISHVHSCNFQSEDSIIVCDLGLNQVFRYNLTAKKQAQSSFFPGRGPRHSVVTPTAIYVGCELSSTVLVLSSSLLSTSQQKSTRSSTQSYISELVLKESLLFVANRGPNTISIFEVGKDGLSFRVQYAVGDWPRHFVIDGGVAVVACQRGDAVVGYEAKTGKQRWRVGCKAPSCVTLI